MSSSIVSTATALGLRCRPYNGPQFKSFQESWVPMAIALSSQPLLGQPVMVKPSEAEKNLVQSTTATAGPVGGFIGPYLGGTRRVCSFLLRLLCRSSKCWLELSLRYSYLLLPRYLVLLESGQGCFCL